MTRLFLTFFTVAGLLVGLQAQTQDDYDEAVVKFKERFNAENYTKVYALFASDMREVLSIDASKTFFSNIKNSFGNLESHNKVGVNGPFQRYHGVFEDGEMFIDISLNAELQVNGISLVPYEAPTPTDQLVASTSFALPALGDWFVFWGGDSEEENYHVKSVAQRAALDLVIRDETSKSYQGDGSSNADYYAFGQKVLAPADGTVVFAVDGIPDNEPRKMNTMYAPGNSVLLKVAEDEYVLLAHLKSGTVVVSAGDTVKQGDLLGQCGNSGNSSEPHLHIHAQNGESLTQSEGIKMVFGQLVVNGTPVEAHSPVRGETVANP